MAKLSVLSLTGEKVKDITLDDTIWNIEINEPVLTRAINLQLASLRQGTAKTKQRNEVAGSTRKKGTGRARAGSRKAAHRVGGGTVFGPIPRSYATKMNRKERRLALRSALSSKFQEKGITVVENLAIETPKTKGFASILKALGLVKKTLIIAEDNDNLNLSTRNNKSVSVISPEGINVLSILNANNILIDEASVKRIEEVLK